MKSNHGTGGEVIQSEMNFNIDSGRESNFCTNIWH